MCVGGCECPVSVSCVCLACALYVCVSIPFNLQVCPASVPCFSCVCPLCVSHVLLVCVYPLCVYMSCVSLCPSCIISMCPSCVLYLSHVFFCVPLSCGSCICPVCPIYVCPMPCALCPSCVYVSALRLKCAPTLRIPLCPPCSHALRLPILQHQQTISVPGGTKLNPGLQPPGAKQLATHSPPRTGARAPAATSSYTPV